MLAKWVMEIERDRHMEILVRHEGKENHNHSKEIKLINFTVSLWDKKADIPNPISTVTEASCQQVQRLRYQTSSH